MSYPSRSGHGYGNQPKHGLGIGKRFGRGKKQNDWSSQVGPNLRPGALTDYGWHMLADEQTRRQALLVSIQAEGFAATRIKLQVLMNISGNAQLDAVVQKDLQWMDTEAKLE